MRKWIIGKPDIQLSRQLALCGVPAGTVCDVLVSRGITDAQDAAYFFGSSSHTDEYGLFSPYDIPGMQEAADEISDAVERGDKICIYGDYDCDGILATASLYNYLNEQGADVQYFINQRSDGYGMNINNVKMLAQRGVQLIITVDNGISAAAEADLCAELGVKLIITDHHTPPPVLPKALAVVDPHIECPENKTHFRHICGCGVVMKLITAMELGSSGIPVEMMSDLAAVATIGDVMPLCSENRMIVRHGLHYLDITGNIGMKALIEAVSTNADGKRRPFKADSITAAFTIVPRINAAGRMGSAMDAAELFTTDDEERAAELAQQLCRLNNERKSVENRIMNDASAPADTSPEIFERPVLIIAGHGWHKGVIGITASRFCERTGKPVFMISIDENGKGTGSARAPEGYSVYEALFRCSDLLTKFGGHKGAGGFSIDEENIPEFSERLCKAAEGMIFEPEIKAVKSITPQELTVDNITAVRNALEPFGEGNPEPVFLISGAVITSAAAISNGKYTKVTVDFGGNIISFPMFDTPCESFPFETGTSVNIMAVPDINTFNGKSSVTLRVCDIRRSGVNQQKMLNAEREYYKFRSGIMPDKRLIPSMTPSREDYAAVYRTIPPDRVISEDYIYNRLCGSINMCVMHIILDVFAETGLISRCAADATLKRIPQQQGHKADFNSSPTMVRLLSQREENI